MSPAAEFMAHNNTDSHCVYTQDKIQQSRVLRAAHARPVFAQFFHHFSMPASKTNFKTQICILCSARAKQPSKLTFLFHNKFSSNNKTDSQILFIDWLFLEQ